jgi:hypothetical protein
MHPSLLYQIAAARNDELRQCAARVSTTSVAGPARRWPRWVRRITTRPAGRRPERDPRAITSGSSRPRATSTLSAERMSPT